MNKLTIKKNQPLNQLTTFNVGGNAKYFAETKNKNELVEAVGFAESKKLPIFILGGGSDILISDKGFPGLVLRYKDNSFSNIDKGNYVLIKSAAGMIWDDLVKESVDKKLQGIECLSGIPGSVGAAPIQNIGAYGQELKDTFIGLTAYDIELKKFIELSKSDCRFSYRTSIFKIPKFKGRYIILDISLKLTKNRGPALIYESLISYFKERKIKNPTLKDVREAVLLLRGKKIDDPSVLGNAGSFFKNPIVKKSVFGQIKKIFPEVPFYDLENEGVKLFAGWLIEKAGWKGKSYKNAKVSEKSALVITNPNGRASAKEIMDLAKRISSDVYKKFKVRLEPEVQFIGFG